jgi:hypothetical protein
MLVAAWDLHPQDNRRDIFLQNQKRELIDLGWIEFAVSRQQQIAELLAKAGRYRALTRNVINRETAARILDLAQELDCQAQLHLQALRQEAHSDSRSRNMAGASLPARQGCRILAGGGASTENRGRARR